MSKIAVAGNASGTGTLTIAAPNTNSDQTITLPDATGSFVTADGSGNITIASGTANGVTYLNSSKVLTSGSALTFDGTNLGIGTSSPSTTIDINGGTKNQVAIFRSTDAIATIGFADNTTPLTGNLSYVTIGAEGNSMVFNTNLNERMKIDSSGNLGLGVSPSAWWSDTTALQIGSNASIYSYNPGLNNCSFTSNSYLNSSGLSIYINDGFATAYQQFNSSHIWRTAPSGTAGDAISFTQAMTLTAAGNLALGSTGATGRLSVNTGAGVICFRDFTSVIGSGTGSALDFLNEARTTVVDGGIRATNLTLVASGATPLIFNTNNTERARIDSAGNVGIGTSSPVNKLDLYNGDQTLSRDTGGASGTNSINFRHTVNTVAAAQIQGEYTSDYRAHLIFKINTSQSNISPVEVARITNGGKVGIGTSAPNEKLTVVGGLATTGIVARFLNPVSGGNAKIGFSDTLTYNWTVGTTNNNFTISSAEYSTNAGTERMRITGAGNVGIGTSSPAGVLDAGGNSLSAEFYFRNNGSYESGGGGATIANFLFGGINIAQIRNTGTGQRDGIFKLLDEGVAKVVIAANNSRGGDTYFNGGGNVGIGTSSPSHPLNVVGSIKIQDNSHPFIVLQDIGNSTSQIGVSGSGAALDNVYIAGYNAVGLATYDLRVAGANGYINTRSNLSVGGALSKGSGSFRIDHPLPEKTETHHLIHSFIEGPQADLIYRGKVNLVGGVATVNIDTAATMTQGTFIMLCRDVQCFTTNESDWTPVRGSVSGNILKLEAEDSASTASISWMVIGERQDKHMMDTDWTDENGKVIVEPLKSELPTRATQNVEGASA